MRPASARIVLAFVATLTLPCQAATAIDLDAYLETVRQTHDLPALAAAVAVDGSVVAAATVGTRVHGQSLPATIDDRFHIGSDAKAMTATLAGMMVDEGKLGWKSTIGEVLGDEIEDINPALAAVTLEQLLSHSSGIPSDDAEMLDLYFNVDAFDYNPAELRKVIFDAWKTHEPVVPDGSPFQYSNFGYMTAGMMIETAAGKPWELLIHERLFQPLGLASAGLGPQATLGLIDAPVGHRVDEDGTVTPMLWGPAADMPPVLGPAGNVHMSVVDFAGWAAWNAAKGQRGPALVTPETLATIHEAHVRTPHIENPRPGTPQDGHYAFGWGLVTFDWAGKPLLVHNGSNSMNLAKILVDTDADLGLVIMTNFPGASAESAAAEVLEHLYKEFAPQ